MLFQIGPATISTFPFSTDHVNRATGADWAAKDLIGRRRGREFMGEGDETLKLSGTILPYNNMAPGSMLILDILHGLRLAGMPIFCMRGDLMPIGWYVLEKLEEDHNLISATGIGQTIKYDLTLTKVSNFGFDAGYSLLGTIINLFGSDTGLGSGSNTGSQTDVMIEGIQG